MQRSSSGLQSGSPPVATTTIFSVLGGVFGYLIGLFLWDLLGEPIIHFYNLEEKFNMFKENIRRENKFRTRYW